MDRYAYSGVAFSAAKGVSGMDLTWCAQPDAGLPAPDAVFFMDIPVDKAAARAGFGGERYENPVFQKVVREKFDMLAAGFVVSSSSGSSSSGSSSSSTGAGGSGSGNSSSSTTSVLPAWISVDAAGTIEDIHAHLMGMTKDVAAKVALAPVRKLWAGEVLE